jgi:hypothetical protein
MSTNAAAAYGLNNPTFNDIDTNIKSMMGLVSHS